MNVNSATDFEVGEVQVWPRLCKVTVDTDAK